MQKITKTEIIWMIAALRDRLYDIGAQMDDMSWRGLRNTAEYELLKLEYENKCRLVDKLKIARDSEDKRIAIEQF